MFEIFPISKSLWRNKTAAFLIITQLTLTIAIISNAIFFIYQRQVKMDRPTGLDTNSLLAMSSTKVNAEVNLEDVAKNDMNFIRAMPGVIDATLISRIPLSGGGNGSAFSTEMGEEGDTTFGNVFSMTEHGINTLNMNLIEGRNFTPEEISYAHESDYTPDNTSMIISKSLADILFPDESAIGRTIYEDRVRANTVVGVVDRMMGSWPDFPESLGGGQIVFLPAMNVSEVIQYQIRTNSEIRGEVLLEVVESLRERDSSRMISREETMENILKRSYREDNAMIKILITVVLALVLVNALGIVGLTTFWVNQRRKQIGVRRAMGATKAAIVRYFLVENSIMCFCAAFFGGALALAASDVMVRVYSLALIPWQFVLATAVTIMILTLLAAAMPAYKAAQISPAEATA